jgi:hypothetical protein
LSASSGSNGPCFHPTFFARIRVALWFADAPSSDQRNELEGRLSAATGPFWGGLWIAAAQTSNADRALLESLWEEGAPHAASVSIRINERHRSLSVWLRPLPGPPWPTDPEADAGRSANPLVLRLQRRRRSQHGTGDFRRAARACW